jgi:hypothetical protein
MKSILLNYSQTMQQEMSHAFYYDYKLKVNVIKNKDGLALPFVNSKLDELCIVTKTEAIREADDAANELLLISTKTRYQMESDD